MSVTATTERSSVNDYRPSLVSPPGTTLGELLEEKGIKQTEFATRLGVTPKFINELVSGKAIITPPTALALEKTLGVPADFWLVRDARYQEILAREKAQTALAENVGWLEELPLKDLKDYGLIKPQPDKPSYVAALLSFFGVASVEAWREQYISCVVDNAAYRKVNAKKSSPGSIAAWLRVGELCAEKIECAPFNREKFLDAVSEARRLTLEEDPAVFCTKLKDLFAECGVAVVVVRAPKHCPVSGVVRWLTPQKALVQLSMKFLRNDSFWFTFFHECGHIALHGKKILFLEGTEMSNSEEDEADRFAADRLIPPTDLARFSSGAIEEGTVKSFAKDIGIAPGIVVGRLQNDGLLKWSEMNSLKQRYEWVPSK